MKKTLALILAVVMLALCLTACGSGEKTVEDIQKEGVLTIATSPDFPPFESLGSDGSVQGIEIEIMNLICEKLGVELKIEQMDFEAFVHRTDDAPNFMSSVIFLRECWNLGKDHVRDTADGYRWFCIVYWGAALLRLPCLYYYLPLVIQRNPARTYISKFPYYIIVEMCDLFQDLDNEIPGLYNFWMQHLRRKWMWTLPGVSEDRSFYRPHEAEFLPHLNQSERRWLKIWLYAPFPTLLRKTYRRFYKRPINC